MVRFRIAIFIVLFRILQLSSLVSMTDKRQRIFISENVKIPVAQTFY
jgi:hypothetical protein